MQVPVRAALLLLQKRRRPLSEPRLPEDSPETARRGPDVLRGRDALDVLGHLSAGERAGDQIPPAAEQRALHRSERSAVPEVLGDRQGRAVALQERPDQQEKSQRDDDGGHGPTGQGDPGEIHAEAAESAVFEDERGPKEIAGLGQDERGAGDHSQESGDHYFRGDWLWQEYAGKLRYTEIVRKYIGICLFI